MNVCVFFSVSPPPESTTGRSKMSIPIDAFLHDVRDVLALSFREDTGLYTLFDGFHCRQRGTLIWIDRVIFVALMS